MYNAAVKIVSSKRAVLVENGRSIKIQVVATLDCVFVASSYSQPNSIRVLREQSKLANVFFLLKPTVHALFNDVSNIHKPRSKKLDYEDEHVN